MKFKSSKGVLCALSKVLKEVLDMVWWNKLPAVRWVIAVCRAHNFSRASIYQFVWKLFSSASATKASQEDVLQGLSHSARANRRKDIRLTRAMHVVCTSKRLEALPVAPLKLAKGELASHGGDKVTLDEFQPRRLKTFNTDGNRSEIVYSAINIIKSKAKQEKCVIF